MTRKIVCAVFALLVLRSIMTGANYPAPVQGDFTIKNFQFDSAETLPELRLHYRTLGTPIPMTRESSGMRC